jgi:hypothetical protein
MRWISLLLFLMAAGFCQAQVPDVRLSAEHLSRIEHAMDPAKKLKLYHRFYHRDSARTMRRFNTALKRKSDSLSRAWKKVWATESKVTNPTNIPLGSSLNRRVLTGTALFRPPFKNPGNRFQDSLAAPANVETKLKQTSDSLAQSVNRTLGPANQKFAIQSPGVGNLPSGTLPVFQAGSLLNNFHSGASPIAGVSLPQAGFGNVSGLTGKYTNLAGQYGHYSGYLNGKDSTAGISGQSLGAAEQKIESAAMSRFAGAGFRQFQQQNDLMRKEQAQWANAGKQLNDSASVAREAKTRGEKMAMQYIGDHPEVMKPVQRTMDLLMKKYSTVPNSSDLSTAIRRTSLRGKSFREHLLVGFNFQILSIKPPSVDFNGMAGYKFNTKFAVGVGGTYRVTLRDSVRSLARQVFGYKLFANYDVVRNFFGYTEFDRNAITRYPAEDGKTEYLWKNSWLIGAGRKFLVRPKVYMTATLLYDVFHKPGDPIYPRPLMLRIGFQLSELALLKRKPPVASWLNK